MKIHSFSLILVLVAGSSLGSASRLNAEPAVLGIGPSEGSAYDCFDAWRMSNRILPYAKAGNEKALHDFFTAAYLRASQPFTGGEDVSQMTSNFDEVAESVGDKDFATALACERSEVVSAVRFISEFPSGKYPETEAVLA